MIISCVSVFALMVGIVPLVVYNSSQIDLKSNNTNTIINNNYNNDNSKTNNETTFNTAKKNKKNVSDIPDFIENNKEMKKVFDDLLKHVPRTTTEVDPSVKICQFNSGSDSGITAACLNALALLDINNGNQFLQKLTQKIKSNMVSIKDHVAFVNSHDFIKEVIDELGDDMFPETMPNQMKIAIKNDLLGNAKNPIEFVQSLAKISGMEKSNDFTKIIKRCYSATTGEKLIDPQIEWTNPILKLNYRESFSYFQNMGIYGIEDAEKKRFSVENLQDLIEHKNLSFEDYEFARKNYDLEPIKNDFPRKVVMVSFEELLPISSISLLEDWENPDYMFNFNSSIKVNGISEELFCFELSSIICYNVNQKDLFEDTFKSIPKNGKFSQIIYNSDIKSFTIIDDLEQKKVRGCSLELFEFGHSKCVSKKSLHNLFKIDNNNYRIPLIAFFKRAQK